MSSPATIPSDHRVTAALADEVPIRNSIATQLFSNYLKMPLLFIVPLLAVAGLIGSRMYLGQRKMWLSWACSCLMIVAVTFFGIVGLFPALLRGRLVVLSMCGLERGV